MNFSVHPFNAHFVAGRCEMERGMTVLASDKSAAFDLLAPGSFLGLHE